MANQLQTLTALLQKARNTGIGRRYGFSDIRSYEDFKNLVPIHFYSDLSEHIDLLKNGEADVLWPGNVASFAVSAGTTGKGKHLPLTDDRLQSDKQFMRKIVWSYLRQRPNLFSLAGKHISLPGSIERVGGYRIGEISGFTAHQTPLWLKPFQLIDPVELTALSFREKFDKVISQSINATNIRVISAVPGWIFTLFQEVLSRTGKNSIAEVWPNLRLLVCGGVKLANYRPHLEQLVAGLKLDFIETYGASEGYFAFTDDLDRSDMHLVTGNGIFYEFIPEPLPDEKSLSIQETCTLSEVRTGVPYAVVVSTNAGLWRYALRDIVEFTSVDPPRIMVRGRVSEMLDEYGEGLYGYEAEEALNHASEMTGNDIGTFSIDSRLDSEKDIPRHHWYVQFFKPVHTNTLERMAEEIDRYLQKINRHYAIRRESEVLGMPCIRSITQTQINNWLEANGKDNAQGKLPRLLPKGSDSEALFQ